MDRVGAGFKDDFQVAEAVRNFAGPGRFLPRVSPFRRFFKSL